MSKALLTAVTVVCMSAVACNDVPTTPDSTDVSLSMASRGPAVVERVTGNAHSVGEGVERTVAFEMRKYEDGSVEGWYHSLRRGPGGVNIRVRIDCLHVSGNRAWAGGVVVSAINPDNNGRPYSFFFVDNGEGANAMPDEAAILRFQYYDCMEEPAIDTRPRMIGNLQVSSRP